MPQMGESVTEGTVLEWHKQEGEFVEEGETVVEVSTDKVDAEVPAPASGTLTRSSRARTRRSRSAVCSPSSTRAPSHPGTARARKTQRGDRRRAPKVATRVSEKSISEIEPAAARVTTAGNIAKAEASGGMIPRLPAEY